MNSKEKKKEKFKEKGDLTTILIDRIMVNYHLIKMMLSSLLIGILRMDGPPVIKGIIHMNREISLLF